MSVPAHGWCANVRRAQLRLLGQVIDRLESATCDLTPYAETPDYPVCELAEDYIKLIERMETTLRSLKQLHFTTAGRFAAELRRQQQEHPREE